MKRYTNFQLTKDIITKLSTVTITCEVDFDNCEIGVTHIDENGIKYVLSVFYEEFISDEINFDFIINSLEELVKRNNEERIRLEEEEENRLKNLAKKFGIL